MTNSDQPAFPVVQSSENVNGTINYVWSEGGLTIRQYFAAKAMHAIRSIGCRYTGSEGDHTTPGMIWTSKDVANLAVQDADALIENLTEEA